MLTPLIQLCWTDFQQKKQMSIVVNPSIPILWFGNMDEYQESKLKIVTVGLNPSCVEFRRTRNAPFDISLRFPRATRLTGQQVLDAADIQDYKAAMNEYFIYNPYCEWFKYNERILHALDASYHYSGKHRAIHVDIYSPIATNPTWGKLVINQKKQLASKYYDFNNVINLLNPDVIIVAADAGIVNKVFKNVNGASCDKNNCISSNQATGYNPYVRGYRLLNNKKLIWVKNCNGKPLQDIKNDADVIWDVKNVYSKL